MKYTTDKPTVPGWYWYKEYKDWKPKIAQVNIWHGDGLIVDGSWAVKYYHGYWAGPILEPEKED